MMNVWAGQDDQVMRLIKALGVDTSPSNIIDRPEVSLETEYHGPVVIRVDLSLVFRVDELTPKQKAFLLKEFGYKV